MPSTVIVILIRTGKLHSVAYSIWMNRCGKCITSVSAESRHAQTVLVTLRSHRKWRVFHRLPHTSVSLYLNNYKLLYNEHLANTLILFLLGYIYFIVTVKQLPSTESRSLDAWLGATPTYTCKCYIMLNRNKLIDWSWTFKFRITFVCETHRSVYHECHTALLTARRA